ncbi:MAG TPA: hypothetical protein VFI42_00080 [Thermomicrobiaceae bacterium]|nr:hypothetical protein [Thermomicrobiaceae bacterium]
MGYANDAGAGALAGMAGGLALVGAMLAGRELGLVERPFPLAVEQRAERELGVARDTGHTEELAAALAGHLAISAGLGALYGVLQSSVGFGPFPAGPLYGAAVYAVNMAGIGPALDLAPGPWNVSMRKADTRFAMHLLYGLVTAYAYPKVQQELGPSQGRAQQQFAGRNWHTPTNAPLTWQPTGEEYRTVGAAAQAEVNEPYSAPY